MFKCFVLYFYKHILTFERNKKNKMIKKKLFLQKNSETYIKKLYLCIAKEISQT